MTEDQKYQFHERARVLAGIIAAMTGERAYERESPERQAHLLAQARRVLREHDPAAVSVARIRARNMALTPATVATDAINAYLEHLERED